MDKIAFLFPGQGAQFVGMGKDFYKNDAITRQTYEEANDRLGFSMSSLCFEGSEEELMRTENAQPAILTTSIAILRVLNQAGFVCNYTAGLSLGEYSALVNAKSIHFADAAELVQKRGRYMNQVLPQGSGKMGAIVGLSGDQVQEAVNHAGLAGIVQIANYNTPEQIVVSGEKEAVKSALKKAKELGATKALLLPVSAAFHCRLMEPAGRLLEKDLESIDFMTPQIPVVSNVDAKLILHKDEISPALIRQVSNSVLWQQSVELLLNEGVRKFVEIGPGTTLSNFVKSIASHRHIEVISQSVGDLEGLENTRKLLMLD